MAKISLPSILPGTRRWLAQLGRCWLHTLTLTLVAALFALDRCTDQNLNLLPLYLLPVWLAMWYLGRRVGLAYALACIAVWIASTPFWQHYQHHTAVDYWNTFMRLFSFCLLVFLLFLIKGRFSELLSRMEKRTEALRENEAILQAFFDSPGLQRGIVETLPDDILHLRDNEVTAGFFGRSPKSLRHQRASALGVPPDIIRQWLTHYATSRQTGQPVSFEYAHDDEKSRHHFSVTVSYLGPGQAGPRYAYAVQDTTKRKRAEQALQQSQALLQSVMEGTTDAVFVKDTAGRYLLFNSAAARFTGKSAAEVLGKDDTALFPPTEARQVMTNDRRVMDSGSVMTYEDVVTTANGVTTTFLSTKGPIRDSQGHVIGLFGISRDITERKRTEQQLAESEAKFSVAFRQSPYAIIISRLADGWILDANDAFFDLTGFSRAETIDNTSIALGLWVDPSVRHHAIQQLQADGRVAGIEFKFKVKAGQIRTGMFSAHVIQIQHTPHILSIINDITESKRVAEALQLQSEIMRNMAEGVVLVRATDQTIVSVNPKFEQMFGYSPDELLGQPITVVNSSTDRSAEEVSRDIVSHLVRHNFWNGEVRNRKKNGADFWCRATVSTFHHPEHGVVWVSIVTDITAQKQAEAALLEISEREQARIGQDLHDGLCQHLVGTAFATSALGQKLADLGVPEMNDLQAIATMLDDAITQTRKVARGLFPVEIEAEGLTLALQKLAENTQRRAEVSCRFACPEPVLIRHNSVATQLFRIAQEAVTNALKHAQPRHLVIRLTRSSTRLELAVLDDGIGLPALPPNHPGLGLHIMNYRAQTIGGRLDIYRRPEGGTVVDCSLPLSLSGLAPAGENEKEIS